MTDSEQTVVSYLGSTGERVAMISDVREDAQAHIVFCPGFHSTMLGNKARALAAYCQGAGWSYTRFDYRGHGQSDGAPESFDLDQGLEDTLAVLDHISSNIVLI